MTALIVLAVLAAVIYLVFYVLFPLGRGAIYEPSSPERTRTIAAMAAVAPGERSADLGSGDGRVVIALAEAGAEAHGYEINPFLVMRARRNVRRAGLSGKAFIHWGSFWRADFARFNVITVFQVGFIMGRLEAKVMKEMAPGSRVVSHHWRFPRLAPATRREDVYLYRVGTNRAATARAPSRARSRE